MTKWQTKLLQVITLAAALLTGGTGLAMADDAVVKSGQKIAFLGHSVTQIGTRPGGFITLSLLGLKANGINVTAINAGLGGNCASDMLDRLDRDVLSKKPDWLVLNCGGNDAWSKCPLEKFKAKATKIVERAQAAGIHVVILAEPTIYTDVQMLITYNKVLSTLAAEKKCPWADLYTPFQASCGANPWAPLTTDGFHPNAQGFLVMARGVLRAFGLSESQTAKADKAMLDEPNTYECSLDLKICMSLRRIQRLDEIAKQRKMQTDEILRLLFAAELFPGVPPKTRGEIEAFLDANRGKDPWTTMQTNTQRRLNVLLPK